jgi:low affinity Fe/Cu permease
MLAGILHEESGSIMAHRRNRGFARRAEALAQRITQFVGSTAGFVFAVGAVAVWALSGPLFRFSSDWQLVINTGTTIVTFLMVFLIQRSQNKEALAVQLKLNELVAALEGASNRLLNVEDRGEEDLAALHRHYATLAKLAENGADMKQSHSIEEAEKRHAAKASKASGKRQASGG